MADKKKPPKQYEAVVGLDLPAGRFEAGDTVPAQAIAKHKWLVTSGKVKEVT